MAEAPDTRAEDLHGTAVGGHDARAGLNLAVGEYRLVEPDGLEDAQNLVVDYGGPRQRIGLVIALERQRADAALPQQQSQQLPHRPKPADDHLVIDHHTAVRRERPPG